MTVYDVGGVTLKLHCDRQTESGITVTLTASNATQSDVTNFTLQAAVPKVVLLMYLRLFFFFFTTIHILDYLYLACLVKFLAEFDLNGTKLLACGSGFSPGCKLVKNLVLCAVMKTCRWLFCLCKSFTCI